MDYIILPKENKKKRTPPEKKHSSRSRNKKEKRESNEFPSRREGTARFWDDGPRSPFGPNGAFDI